MKNDVQTKINISNDNDLNKMQGEIQAETTVLTASKNGFESPAKVLFEKASAASKVCLIGKEVEEGLNLKELRISAAKAKSAFVRQMAVADDTSSTGTDIANSGIDLSSAVEVNADTVYQVSDFTAGHQLMLKISTQGMPKLSAVIQFDAAAVIETAIFKVDANNNPTIVADSVNMINNFDIASCLPDGGVYYVIFEVYSGGGNAGVCLLKSLTYSVNEPNDAPSQAPLRHEEFYLYDTFDNSYDLDFVRVQITKPEPVAISIGFADNKLTGKINFGIYHKTDENGNAVNQWIIYQSLDVPNFKLLWSNTAVKGEVYILAQYVSGDVLNQPYTLCFTPVSKLQFPHYALTGRESGMTGLEYGYVGGYHWVMGSFKVITDFRNNHEQVNLTADGQYPCFPTYLMVQGLNASGTETDTANTTMSQTGISKPDGLITLSALLPGSYGTSGGFVSSVGTTHKYDFNFVQFAFLEYTAGQLNWHFNYEGDSPNDRVPDPYVEFSPFLNVSE